MTKLTKRSVDAAKVHDKDYIIWDEELPSFGLRVFASGRRSYVIQYRARGRSRRFTIGKHGIWTAETARREAKVLLGKIARGGNPAEQRLLDREAMTVQELCERYRLDLEKGLILGKGDRPKKPSTISTDIGRIDRHILPLLGNRRVKDLTTADINRTMKDIMAGKTRVSVKTDKLRGRSIVRGGAGTAARTIGLLGGILTYAVDLGVIDRNPASGVRRPKDQVKSRRLSEHEYRLLGKVLEDAATKEKYETAAAIIRLLALTGCRRSEMTQLRWNEVDLEGSCLRLSDSKEGASVRPIGLAAVEALERHQKTASLLFIFPGWESDTPFGALPGQWRKIFASTELADITPHVLRHSFASIANDLGFTEATIAALVGHSRASITSRYIHTIDGTLIAAADTIAAFIQGLLDGADLRHVSYAVDRASREKAVAQFLGS